jgi:hypothetical protein
MVQQHVWDQVGTTRTRTRSRQLGAHRERTVVTEGGDVAAPTEGGASPGAPTIIDARHGRRPQSWRSTACLPQLLAGTSCSGTIWGSHVMHGDERSARLCTSRTAANQPYTARDLRKGVTAIYWGSSGRRFKSCQPDTVSPTLSARRRSFLKERGRSRPLFWLVSLLCGVTGPGLGASKEASVSRLGRSPTA